MEKNITTVIINNKSLKFIEKDVNFGKNLVNAIRSNNITNEQIDIHAGTNLKAALVVEQHPFDKVVLLSIGYNYGSIFSETVDLLEHHSPEAKMYILRDVAYRMGYFLRKRTK